MEHNKKASALVQEFRRIKKNHSRAIRCRAARTVPGASVMRVFEKGTKKLLFNALYAVPMEELKILRNEEDFRRWFGNQLDRVVRAIRNANRSNSRIGRGYKWGHATKVLVLYIRDMVYNSRYFTDRQVTRIGYLLYVPIDSVIMKKLRDLGMTLPFKKINEIDTSKKFFSVQKTIGGAANRVGVPRVWFDDSWAKRS